MIYYAIQKLVEAGIKQILIVTGIQHCGSIIQQCGDGSDFNCNLTYKIQTKAGGIAQALLLAENFAANDDLCVILGDNIFNTKLKNTVTNFTVGAHLFLKEVDDPHRFGVASFNKIDNKIIITDIQEKPAQPKSNYAVTGIYCYDKTVFDKIRTLKPSARGQYQITDVNKLYMEEGNLTATLMKNTDIWTDAGTFESLKRANKLMEKYAK